MPSLDSWHLCASTGRIEFIDDSDIIYIFISLMLKNTDMRKHNK